MVMAKGERAASILRASMRESEDRLRHVYEDDVTATEGDTVAVVHQGAQCRYLYHPPMKRS